jgi:hypothetical protein
LFEPDHRERTYSSGDEKPFFLTEIDDYKYHEVLFIVCADSLILTNLSEILIST